MKKLGVFVFLSLLLVSSFVSAQPSPDAIGKAVDSLVNGIAQALTPVARILFGNGVGQYLTGEELAIKFLVFVLVLVFAMAGARKIPLLENKPTSAFIVAFVLGVLGVRFITTGEIIDTLWLPTSTFAVALTSIIPFAIFFFIIEGFDSSILRKFGWTTYLVIFLYFALSRLENNAYPGAETSVWIYGSIAVISGALIFYDREIYRLSRRMGIDKITDRNRRIQAIGLAGEIDELYKKIPLARSPADLAALKQEISMKESNLKNLIA